MAHNAEQLRCKAGLVIVRCEQNERKIVRKRVQNGVTIWSSVRVFTNAFTMTWLKIGSDIFYYLPRVQEAVLFAANISELREDANTNKPLAECQLSDF